MAALIPLEELMDPPVRQRYDMPEDPEVFDMLNAVARQKEVRFLSRATCPSSCVLFFCCSMQGKLRHSDTVWAVRMHHAGRTAVRGDQDVLG